MASARPRLWVTARLQVSAPGQATTSRDSSAPGSAMPMADSRWWSSGQLALGQAAEHEVLAVGDAHVGAELALDRGEGPELGGGDVAEAGVGDGRHGALGDAAHDVGVVPGLVRVVAAERDRGALAERGGRAEAEAGRRRRRASATVLGDAAGPGGAGDEELALLEDAGLELVPAHRVDEPLHAGPELVVAVAVVGEHAEDRLDRGEQLLAGRELLEGERGVRVGAEAAGDEHAEAGLAGAVVERAGGGDHADVVEHRLAAVGLAAGEVDLELAGQPLGERVVEEVLEGGLGPRADVEVLVGAGAGEVAAHHVADGVAARLPGGEPDRWPCRAGPRGPARGRRSGTACSAGW